jgi:hypothetical protein
MITKKHLLALVVVLSAAGCANRQPANQMKPNLYQYSGDVVVASTVEPSEILEIDGFIKQKGRAYVAAVNGVQVAGTFADFEKPIQIGPGLQNLTLRYFDGTTVQCQVSVPVTIEPKKKYKVHLQSDRGRENIKISLKNVEKNALEFAPVLAVRLAYPFNHATILPIDASTLSNGKGTGCY